MKKSFDIHHFIASNNLFWHGMIYYTCLSPILCMMTFTCSCACILDEIMKKIREAGFHIAARKETELTKEMAEQLYVTNKESEYYVDLVDHMMR